jgi:hypothetical protein
MRKFPHHHSPRVIQTLHRWHRRIGLISAIFVVILAITGLPLHHADSLGLTQSHVKSDWLLDSYGIEPPQNYTSFAVGNHYITASEGYLYFNHQVLSSNISGLKGAVALSNLIVAVTPSSLFLLTLEGELIDQQSLPNEKIGTVNGIAVEGEQLIIGTNRGMFAASENFDSFNSINFFKAPKWITSVKLPESHWQTLQQNIRGQALNWERVLIDTHSGRLFGPLGPWVMDAAAILFLLMAISGIWLWTRKKRW